MLGRMIITRGMQQYVSDKVQRQAMSLNRKEEFQLISDADTALGGRYILGIEY